ncbi:hypothetical protein M422DRAFT_99000, partial [Sphaerobolus stellatus SS14]
PPEILDNIAAHINLPQDLLSLAVTARAFHAIVVPNHLQFRDIRCDPRRVNLWRSLAQKPAYAARIRRL